MDAKTALDRIGVGKKRDVSAPFLAMTSHYVFDPELCDPAAGWEKGQVEKNVRDARHHAKGHVVCTHGRIIERSHRPPWRVIYDWHHYLAVVQRKPGALRNRVPFVEVTGFRKLPDHMLRRPGGDREMVDVLSLVLHHNEQAVLCAVELALEAGVPTKTHVLNLLHRLVDGAPIDQPDVAPPAALF